MRRIGAGKKILLGDISAQALERVGDDFRRCGYDVETIQVNALQKESVEAFARKAAELGPVMYFIDTAGALQKATMFPPNKDKAYTEILQSLMPAGELLACFYIGCLRLAVIIP